MRNDMDKAEEYYARAIDADPNDAYNLGEYARFLRSVRNNDAKAEELEARAKSIAASR
jgi:Tfp pilus assembly protein PilF